MAETSATLLLRTEPIGKLLLRYSLPAIAAMVVFSLYNIIDSIFIGHGVGPLAISGLAITFPVMNLTFALVLLVGIGGASICSIRLGQQDIDGATRVLGNVLLLGLINGVTFGLLSQLVLDPVLTAFGASEHTLPYARDFMQIILYGLPVTCTMFGLNHVMRATGYPQKAMLSAVLTVGMNVILAPIFIFWLEWGIRGAAVATVLSQCVGMVWVLSHFRNPNSTVHFRRGTFRLRRKIVSSIFSIGMSPFLLNVCACLVTVLINIGLKQYGGDMAIGAFGILNRILILFVMLVMGLTQGMQPIVGYNYGAQQFERVKQTLKYGVITGGLITTAGFLAGQFTPEIVARMFTNDAGLISLSVEGMHLATLVFPLVGIQIVVGNFFQSIGKAKLSIFLSLTRQLLFLAPCLLILPRFFGLNGIWISLPVSDSLSFVASMGVLYMFLREMRRAHHSREV
ncbi:MATE family efflux transporter [uncultured Bilophila sp.]|uniref:MATE family efflux transporter n=2 Tax=uncultured Bilophila sp. TaxID=529385 RepID=UPI00266F2F9A|nr:MATE family efflux transporter [uncultured Bilophila sp.]